MKKKGIPLKILQKARKDYPYDFIPKNEVYDFIHHKFETTMFLTGNSLTCAKL